MRLWRRVYTEQRRVVLPLLAALAVNVAVLLLAVLPLKRSVTAADAAALQATVELGNARRLSLRARAAAASRQRADEQLQQFYADVLPRDFANASKTTNLWLQKAAEQAGLQFRGAHFDWKPVRESRLSRAFSTVTLVGRYPNIRRFLYAVETASEFIVVEKVELAQSGSTQPGASDALEVSLVVSTDFLTPARHP